MNANSQYSITVITATGGRPDAISILGHYINAQTYAGSVRWIFVDDAEPETSAPPVPANWTVDIVRPRPLWKLGQNTQHRNMLAALDRVGPNDSVVIFEDDDALHPKWLESVVKWLETDDLVGESFTHYYNLENRTWKRNRNDKHASLCATACRGEALKELVRVCESGARMIDHELWRRHAGRLYDSDMVVGIKGLPGRPGIGMGHRMSGTPDRNLSKLRELLGENIQHYAQWVGKL